MRSPRRTEYRNHVFDSKAEAVFARTLDLAGRKWLAHPTKTIEELRSVTSHPWDFVVWDTRGKTVLVEYKPAPPTETYIEELRNSFYANAFDSVLIWGNPWELSPLVDTSSNDYCPYVCFPIMTTFGRFGTWFVQSSDNGESVPFSHRHTIGEMFGITRNEALEAKRFRFDLR